MPLLRSGPLLIFLYFRRRHSVQRFFELRRQRVHRLLGVVELPEDLSCYARPGNGLRIRDKVRVIVW